MKKTNKRRIAGFTLDQTILVVAVIAILATIIISSVAWNVLNRANATKLNAHLAQINDAIGQYYQDNDFKWPSNAEDLAPYLAGYTVSTGGTLNTPFGGSVDAELQITGTSTGAPNGKILGKQASCTSGVDCYIYVTINNVQAQEMEIADESIDGQKDATKGRLQWAPTATGSARTQLKYWAVKLY